MATLTIHVTVQWMHHVRRLTLIRTSDQTVLSVLEEALRELQINFPINEWQVHYDGRLIQSFQTLEQAIPIVPRETTFALTITWQEGLSRDAKPEPRSWRDSGQPRGNAFPSDEDEDLDDTATFFPTAEPIPPPIPPIPPRPTPAPSVVPSKSKAPGAAAPTMERRARAAIDAAPVPAPPAKRQTTVRYYERMNPNRMFPLLVVISKEKIREVQKKHVQQTGQQIEVNEKKRVEIEPVLPGSHCYPQKCEVDVDKDVNFTFWIVPHVLGELQHSRVVIRQDGKELASIPLKMRVVRQTVTIIMAVLVVLLPFLTTLLQHFRLDFASQLQDGFPVYAQLASFVSHNMSPEVLGGVLLLFTLAFYLWRRPRKRDVFWDIEPVE